MTSVNNYCCFNESDINERDKVSHKESHVFKWDNDTKDIYIQSFSNAETSQSLINICNTIDLTNSFASLDNCLENFCTVIDNVCSPLFKNTINSS